MATISPEQWQVLSPYLDEALQLSSPEREAWLDRLRQKDASLAALLTQLLEEQLLLQKQNFLEVSPLTPTALNGLDGQTVGSYTLVSQIGQGGMGSVWLARRSDGRFERQAAVKFLSIAWVGGSCEERFRREGTFLARLAHPHIAQLLDAGVTANGQPFLILEYVEGQPIDEYCDTRKLAIEPRIRLFLDVLAAVAHAHANLIVHRDIKPSNVLVTKNGQVKLLDFGIAKLLGTDEQAGTPTLLTRDAGSVLTPRYAAPEQLKGEAITTVTDVYTLGLLLFQLLCGGHPNGEVTQSSAELVKSVLDLEPPRMSTLVKQRDGTLIAAARGTSREKLSRRLRGDLELIVAKTLKKDPRERYSSVSALADDLHRYLQHKPITARPDTIAYRARKFLRRYWMPVAAAALVFASLATGLYLANRERVIAQQHFHQLRQLSKRIFDLDKQIRDLPGSTQARQSLVSAAVDYLDRLAPDTAGDLDLMQEIGEGYWRVARIQGVPTELNLGEPKQAEASLKRADEMLDTVLNSRPHSRSALLRSAMVDNDRMILAQEGHRSSDALAFAHKSAARLDALMHLGNITGEERTQATAAYANIALALINMHFYADAVTYAQRTVAISRAGSKDGYRVAQGLSLLANALRYEGDLDGALKAIEQARDIDKSAVYRNEVTRSIDEYGIYLREGLILGEYDEINLGRPQDAIVSLQHALHLVEATARQDPQDATSRMRVASSGIELGNILRSQDPQRALQIYDHALQRLGEIPENASVRRQQAILLANSSYALSQLHREPEAKKRIDHAVEFLKQTGEFPSDRIKLDSAGYIVCRAKADYVADTGAVARAAELYEHLLAQLKAGNPDPLGDLRDAPRLASLYQAMADLYARLGKKPQAEKFASMRRDLWQKWLLKLPDNSFIQRQVAASRSSER